MNRSASEERTRTDSHPTRGLVKAVESLRQQLLDVGKRNKLINAPIRKDRAKQLTIEDELADEVFKIYLQGKSMTFQPVQGEASADSDDESVFLPTEDVEPGTAVAAHHSDRKLQTRLTADRLQKQLLALYRDAQAIEEEQGISVLFLALGFLRWYESDASQIERFASADPPAGRPRAGQRPGPVQAGLQGPGLGAESFAPRAPFKRFWPDAAGFP